MAVVSGEPGSLLAPCPQDAPVRRPTCTTPYIKARAPKPSGPGTEKPRVSARFHRRQIKTPKGSLPVPKQRSPKPLFPRKTRAVHTTSRRGSQTKDRTYTGDRPQVPERGHQRALAGPWTHSHPWPLRTPPQNSRRELGVCRGSGPRRGRPAHQPGICSYGSLSGNFHHEAFQIERKFGKNNHRLDRSICLALLLHFMQKWPLTCISHAIRATLLSQAAPSCHLTSRPSASDLETQSRRRPYILLLSLSSLSI